MSDGDYFDIDGDPFDGCQDDDEIQTANALWGRRGKYKPKQPDDFPCRKCRYASVYFRCERKKGIDKCPGAKWFQEHNQTGNRW